MKTPSLKKIIAIIVSLLSQQVHAECVLNGMNLWQLAECIACSVGAYFEIKQGDFPGDPITVSGHYKLCENISAVALSQQNINASDVILDLGGYSLDNIELVIGAGLKNIVIKNGTIKNARDCIRLADDNQNIVVEDIVFDTIPYQFGSAVQCSGSIHGLLVHNVTVYNGSSFNFIITNASGTNNNIIFENVSCINTDPAVVAAPVNPSAVVYIQECDNLVLKNITLTDQFQELNGIWLDTCSNIDADGVRITSSLALPTTNSPVAYQATDCLIGTHKNIRINGGTNSVFAKGISSTDSSENIFDTCYVEDVFLTGITIGDGNSVLNTTVIQSNSNGFVMGSNAYVENCFSISNLSGYFVGGSASVLKNNFAFNNTQTGFIISGGSNELELCVANNNRDGFIIADNQCSLDSCYANQNTRNGFSINVGDGCFITNSIANNNGQYGFQLSNIIAEANFAGGNPVNGTWNVGQTPPVNPGTTNRNVRLANNTALGNALIPGVLTPGGFVMSGQVFTNNGGLGSPQAFTTQIFPPIGVLNTIQGAIYMDPKPIAAPLPTALGGDTLITNTYANTEGGNLVNDK